MLRKILIVFIPLLAMSLSQNPDLTNSQELDPNGTFRLLWTVQQEAGDIILEVQVKALGWVSIALINEAGDFADLIIGGYDNQLGLPYVYDMSSVVYGLGEYGRPEVDPSPDVILQQGLENTSETIVRWKRSLFTQDQADVRIIPGPMIVGWSYADGDGLTSPQTNAGFANVTFIPIL